MADIFHFLTIEVSPEIVYKAITEKNGIQGWWTPDTVIEPVVGSTSEFNFKDSYRNKMIISDLKPGKRVEWECIEGDPEWIGTLFQFDLERNEGNTILRFKQTCWRSETDFFASCNFQWGRYMKSLKDYCETGKGNPFRPPAG